MYFIAILKSPATLSSKDWGRVACRPEGGIVLYYLPPRSAFKEKSDIPFEAS